MSDKPLIFSTPMVRALLDGRKTMTRRLVSVRGHRSISEFGRSDTREYDWTFRDAHKRWHDLNDGAMRASLRYQAGDRLWVRENHALVGGGDPGILLHQADWRERCAELGLENCDKPPRWTPSLLMPRRLSRLTLTVTAVKLERLNEIGEDDALSEGVSIPATPDGSMLIEIVPNSPLSYAEPRQTGETIDEFIARALTARTLFAALWEKLHGPNTWTANPWVVAISFTAERRNIDR